MMEWLHSWLWSQGIHEFKYWSHHFLAVWPWAGDSFFLNFTVLMSRTRDKFSLIVTWLLRWFHKIQYIKCLPQCLIYNIRLINKSCLFKIILLNNFFRGEPIDQLFGMQGNVQKSWEMFRKDRLGTDVVVLEYSDEDFGSYSTGNDKPLKKVRLSKLLISM